MQLGIGVSTYTEMCGLAPSRWLGEKGYVAGGWERATVRMTPLGKAEVVVGTSPHGQGHVTTFSQIAADALGVPFDDVEIIVNDTAAVPWGLDTYGSRSLVVGGTAIRRAAEGLVEKAKLLAAHLLEADPGDIEFDAGTFRVKGTPTATKSIQELAFASFVAHSMPEDSTPILSADYLMDPETFSFPHGTHLCAVEVDTETGMTKIRKYVCVDDVGNVVNPMIVDGQVHGGIAQGIAQALFEEAVYDDDGNLVTGTFVDYLVPAPPDLPSFTTDRTETPSTTNPLGVKGVGEAGTIASTPAVVNAVVDAVRQSRRRRRPDGVHPGAGLASDPGRQGRRQRRWRRPCRPRHGRLRRREHGDAPREVREHDPGAVRLRARAARSTRRSRPSASTATTPRCWPAASR